MNNKHFIIYYKKGTGTFIITEPRPWARENIHHFDNIQFQGDVPVTAVIEQYLIDNYGFVKTVYNEDNVTVLVNLDPSIDL